ncbi:MAG TPA: type I phosphomannose isomerase catalytic subunit [Candidatus Aquilonibacter sp.]|nr:type I phosphomannose isomerase catalytic subunit [Candidatus Aquilonibacter sp.]
MGSDSSIYPLVIEPKETPAIWGGDALVARFGKAGDPNAKIGESWECWDDNRIVNGAHAGKTIAQLRAELGSRLLGNLDAHRIFPILTKIIDARDWLSVQVHPDDAYAERVEHQHNGKTECWYVLDAQAGAQLVLGWTQDTSRDEYLRRVADGSLGDILRRVPVRAGDAFYLPAGSLHAIGGGIVIFETQQASDLTYRIFDWNRMGADGKPRQLHVDKAADVLDYRRGSKGAIEPLTYTLDGMERTALIVDRRFIVERVTATAEAASLPTNDRPLILMALEHPLQLRTGGDAVRLERYQTALVPAAAEWCAVAAESDAAAPFMLVTPPRHLEEIEVRFMAAGIAQDRIDHFMAQFA